MHIFLLIISVVALVGSTWLLLQAKKLARESGINLKAAKDCLVECRKVLDQ